MSVGVIMSDVDDMEGMLVQHKFSTPVQLHHLGWTDGPATGGWQEPPVAAVLREDQTRLEFPAT